MRKLLLSSIVLSIFAIALTVFQMSCQKEATAQQTGSNYTLPAATSSTLGGVIIGNGLNISNAGLLSVSSSSGMTQQNIFLYTLIDEISNTQEYWIADNTGANKKRIPLNLPTPVVAAGSGRLTPDSKTLIFPASDGNIYSCSIDGSNLKKIIDGPGSGQTYFYIDGTY